MSQTAYDTAQTTFYPQPKQSVQEQSPALPAISVLQNTGQNGPGCVSPYNQNITATGQETEYPGSVMPLNQAQVLPPHERALSAAESANYCISSGPHNQTLSPVVQEIHNSVSRMPHNQRLGLAVQDTQDSLTLLSQNQRLGPAVQDSSTVLPHNQSLGPMEHYPSTVLPHNQSLGPVVQDSSTVLPYNQSVGPVVQDSSTVLPHNQSLSPVEHYSSTVLPHNQSLGPVVQDSSTVLPYNQSLGPVVQDSSTVVLPHNQSLSPALQDMQDSAAQKLCNQISFTTVPESQESSFTSVIQDSGQKNQELDWNILEGDDTVTTRLMNPRYTTPKVKIKIVPGDKIKSPIMPQRTEASTPFTSPITQEKLTLQGKQKQAQSTQEGKDRSVLLKKKAMRWRQELIQGTKHCTNIIPEKQHYSAEFSNEKALGNIVLSADVGPQKSGLIKTEGNYSADTETQEHDHTAPALKEQKLKSSAAQGYSMIAPKKTRFSAIPSPKQDPLAPLSTKQERRIDSLTIPFKKQASPGSTKQNLKPSLRQESVTESPHGLGTVTSPKYHRNKRQEFNTSPKRNSVVMQFKKPKLNPIDHEFSKKDPPYVIPKTQEKEETFAKHDSMTVSKQKPADQWKKNKNVTWKDEKTEDGKETQKDQWVLQNWDEKQARYSPFCKKHNVRERKVDKTEVDWSQTTLSLLVYGSSAQDLSTTNTKHTETLTETQKDKTSELSPTKLTKNKRDEVAISAQDDWSGADYCDVYIASKDQNNNNTSLCDEDEILSTDDEICGKEVLDVDKDVPITNKDKNNNTSVPEKKAMPLSDDDIEVCTVTTVPSQERPESRHNHLKANEKTRLQKQRRIRGQQWQLVRDRMKQWKHWDTKKLETLFPSQECAHEFSIVNSPDPSHEELESISFPSKPIHSQNALVALQKQYASHADPDTWTSPAHHRGQSPIFQEHNPSPTDPQEPYTSPTHHRGQSPIFQEHNPSPTDPQEQYTSPTHHRGQSPIFQEHNPSPTDPQEQYTCPTHHRGQSPIFQEHNPSPTDPQEPYTSPTHHRGQAPIFQEHNPSPTDLQEQNTCPTHHRGQSPIFQEHNTPPTDLQEPCTSPTHHGGQSPIFQEQNVLPVDLQELNASQTNLFEQTVSPTDLQKQNTFLKDRQEQKTSPIDLQEPNTFPKDCQEQNTSPADFQGDASPTDIQAENASQTDLQEQTASPRVLREQNASPRESEEENASTVSQEQNTSPVHLQEQNVSLIKPREQNASPVDLQEQNAFLIDFQDGSPADLQDSQDQNVSSKSPEQRPVASIDLPLPAFALNRASPQKEIAQISSDESVNLTTELIPNDNFKEWNIDQKLLELASSSLAQEIDVFFKKRHGLGQAKEADDSQGSSSSTRHSSPRYSRSRIQSPRYSGGRSWSPRCSRSRSWSLRCLRSRSRSPRYSKSRSRSPRCSRPRSQSPRYSGLRSWSPRCSRARRWSLRCSRSRSQSPRCSRSKSRSPRYSGLRSKSPRCSRSRSWSLRCSRSRSQSPRYSRSRSQSPRYSRSRSWSPRYSRSSRSPRCSRSRSRSPRCSRSRSLSPRYSRSRSQSPRYSRSRSRSPRRSRSRSQSRFSNRSKSPLTLPTRRLLRSLRMRHEAFSNVSNSGPSKNRKRKRKRKRPRRQSRYSCTSGKVSESKSRPVSVTSERSPLGSQRRLSRSPLRSLTRRIILSPKRRSISRSQSLSPRSRNDRPVSQSRSLGGTRFSTPACFIRREEQFKQVSGKVGHLKMVEAIFQMQKHTHEVSKQAQFHKEQEHLTMFQGQAQPPVYGIQEQPLTESAQHEAPVTVSCEQKQPLTECAEDETHTTVSYEQEQPRTVIQRLIQKHVIEFTEKHSELLAGHKEHEKFTGVPAEKLPLQIPEEQEPSVRIPKKHEPPMLVLKEQELTVPVSKEQEPPVQVLQVQEPSVPISKEHKPPVSTSKEQQPHVSISKEQEPPVPTLKEQRLTLSVPTSKERQSHVPTSTEHKTPIQVPREHENPKNPLPVPTKPVPTSKKSVPTPLKQTGNWDNQGGDDRSWSSNQGGGSLDNYVGGDHNEEEEAKIAIAGLNGHEFEGSQLNVELSPNQGSGCAERRGGGVGRGGCGGRDRHGGCGGDRGGSRGGRADWGGKGDGRRDSGRDHYDPYVKKSRYDDPYARDDPYAAPRRSARDPYADDPYLRDPYAVPYLYDPYAHDPYQDLYLSARDPYARDPYARDPYARDPYARDPYARDPYARPPPAYYSRLRDPYANPLAAAPRARDPYAYD